jgi:hypothetical protein
MINFRFQISDSGFKIKLNLLNQLQQMTTNDHK